MNSRACCCPTSSSSINPNDFDFSKTAFSSQIATLRSVANGSPGALFFQRISFLQS